MDIDENFLRQASRRQMDKEHLALMIFDRVDKFGGRTAMRHRTPSGWKDITWYTLGEQIMSIAKALIESGINEGDRIGIYASNCPEWHLADFAIAAVGAVSVPVFSAYSTEQLEYIVNRAGIKLLFVGDEERYDRAMTFYLSSDYLQRVIVFNGLSERTTVPQNQSLADFLETGRKSRREKDVRNRLSHASADDYASIIYTPGTTGEPKGVILTHATFFHQVKSLSKLFPLTENDISLCYLPLSRAFERTWSYFILSRGAVNCYCDDHRRAWEYMLDIQPTCMTAPPSFYQKLYSSIHESMSADSALRQALFRWAIDTGEILARCMMEMRPYTRGQRLRHRLTAMILRDKIMRFVGRRVRFLISGGVALPGKIEELFYAAGIQIYQGYGLTESASLVAINSPGNFMFGTAGKPLDQCEVRISEQGEILARGPNMMAGYYKVRGEAIDAFDEERWLRTGDLGILENGFLRYLGRKTA